VVALPAVAWLVLRGMGYRSFPEPLVAGRSSGDLAGLVALCSTALVG